MFKIKHSSNSFENICVNFDPSKHNVMKEKNPKDI